MNSLQLAQSWLQGHQDQMVNELEQLCNLNSGSDSLVGLLAVSEWLVDYFRPLQRPCQKLSLPSFHRIDDLGIEKTHPTGPALRWDVLGSSNQKRKRLLLTIHYDTVYGPTSNFQKCERYEAKLGEERCELRMRGPGVIDAKGGIIVLRWATLAAMQFLDLSELDLSIVLTPDEEIGSPATIDLWSKIAGSFDFAMLYEPALADGSLVSERKGTGTFIVVVRGKSAHAGRNFHEGRNAIAHACKLALALDSLNGQRPQVTINVGRIRGGDAVNVVPDLAVVRANVRVSSQEDRAWIETQVQQIVRSFQDPDAGYQVAVHGGVHAAPKTIDATTSVWMDLTQSAGAMVGELIRWKPSGGASDGNKLAGLGLPNIDTFGAEGDLLHSDQEWIRVSSLPRKAALSVAVIHSLLTQHS